MKREITDETLQLVVVKSLENAQSLIADANLLREHKRFQRAYTLYQLATEEVGKSIASVLLLTTPGGASEDDIEEYWKIFFNHQKKTKKSSGMDIFICQALHKGNLDDALSFLQTSFSEEEKDLDDFKNKSLYTSLNDGIVKIPSDIIDESMCNRLYFRATSRYTFSIGLAKTVVDHLPEIRAYFIKNPDSVSQTPEQFAVEYWQELLQ